MKAVCPKCGREVSNEHDQTPSFCAGCGANLKSAEQPPPNRKGLFPTVLLTSLLTAILVCAILAGGFYVYSNFDKLADLTRGFSGTKDVFKAKKKLYVQASDITKIELRTENYTRNAASNFPGGRQMLGNVSFSNASLESGSVTFFSDSRAMKARSKSVYDRESKLKSEEKSEFTGTVSAEQFLELAGLIIEKDCFNLDADEAPPVPLSITALSIQSTKGNAYITAYGSDPTSTTVKQIAAVIAILDGKIQWKREK